MDTFDAIRGRRSVRKFKPEPIPREVLEQIVEAARWAPYGTRHDRRTFIVMTAEEKEEFLGFLGQRLEQLLPAMENGTPRRILAYAHSLMSVLQDAAALILVYTALSPEGPELTLTSAATAVQNLTLAAHACGIGSCYTTGAIYLGDDIADYLDMRGHQLVALIPLGYPDDGAETRSEFPRLIWRGLEAGTADAQPAEPEGMRVTGIARACRHGADHPPGG
jgi:nitroreductase